LVRQARSYLTGAVSSTVLIVSAVLVFVLLVSVQAFRDWPVAGLGLVRGDGIVAASSVGARGARSSGAPHGRATVAVPTAGAASGHAAVAGGIASTPGRSGAISRQGGLGSGNSGAGAPRGATSPSGSGSSPSGPSPGPATGGGSGSGGSGATRGLGPGSIGSPSAGVTSAVGNTVAKVDETAGGTLGATGVAKATEGLISGAAAPESAVGHAVDETVGTVGGLLHLHR
jgi:hypothetical protein